MQQGKQTLQTFWIEILQVVTKHILDEERTLSSNQPLTTFCPYSISPLGMFYKKKTVYWIWNSFVSEEYHAFFSLVGFGLGFVYILPAVKIMTSLSTEQVFLK